MTAFNFEEVLVVLEGAPRLRWSATGRGWLLTGLWPEPHDRDALERQLDDELPVLVVLDHAAPVVTALREELRRLPPGVTVRGSDDDDVVDLVVPLLDWLPQPLRRCGREFASQARQRIDTTRHSSLPPLIFDHGRGAHPVRFAQRTPTCWRLDDSMLHSAAATVFPAVPALETRAA